MYFGFVAHYFLLYSVSAYRINVKSNHVIILSCQQRPALAIHSVFLFKRKFCPTWQKTKKPYASRSLHAKHEASKLNVWQQTHDINTALCQMDGKSIISCVVASSWCLWLPPTLYTSDQRAAGGSLRCHSFVALLSSCHSILEFMAEIAGDMVLIVEFRWCQSEIRFAGTPKIQ